MSEAAPSRSVSQLVSLCAQGDGRAWDEFVTRYNRRLLLYVMRACAALHRPVDRDQVLDLVQEIYLRLLANDRRALASWRGESEPVLLGYLATIASAVVTDAVRRERTAKRAGRNISIDDESDAGSLALAQLVAPESGSPERVLLERHTPEQTRAVVESVFPGPNAARAALIFHLYVFEGLTAREIAALPQLAMTVANVEAVIHRTKARLRDEMGES